MDNTEGKSSDTIPYMIVNLDYHDMVYIKKDTPVAYTHIYMKKMYLVNIWRLMK